MIDQSARDRLEQRQIIQIVTSQIQELIELLKSAPFLDGLSIQLEEVRQSLDRQNITVPIGRLEQILKQIKDNQLVVADIREPLAEVVASFKVLNDSLTQQIVDVFSRELSVKGKMDVGSIDSLPAVQIKNKLFPVTGALDIISLPDIEITNKSFGITGPVEVSSLPPVRFDNVAEFANLINESITKLQTATTLAIKATKVEIPTSTSINGPIEITDFNELLDGIEELKKGFNLLIAKENTGFDSTNPMKVEVVAEPVRLVPQPSSSITNISGSAITLGQKTMANSFPVVFASDQTFTFTPVGTQDVNLTKVGGSAFSLGQQLAVASLPVVLTASQLTTLTPLSTIAATQSGTWNIATLTSITNALPAGSNVIGHVITDTGSTTAVTGTVSTSESAPTTVGNGKKTVATAGTRVTLSSSTICKSVTIKALIANTGTIYIGDTSVAASNGFALLAGESISLDIANLTTVNLDSSVNGEGVTYVYVV